MPFDPNTWRTAKEGDGVRLAMGKAALREATLAKSLQKVTELLGPPTQRHGRVKGSVSETETPLGRTWLLYSLGTDSEGWGYGITLVFDAQDRLLHIQMDYF